MYNFVEKNVTCKQLHYAIKREGLKEGDNMEVIIREICLRGQEEYIVDDRDGLIPERKLKIILKALYNSLLTNSKVLETARKMEEESKIIILREVVGEVLNSDDEDESEEEKAKKMLILKEAIEQYLVS